MGIAIVYILAGLAYACFTMARCIMANGMSMRGFKPVMGPVALVMMILFWPAFMFLLKENK